MFLKRLARDLYYWSADKSGRLRSREASMAGALTVLTYHRVLPDDEARRCPFPSLAIPESWFRSHVRWLRQNASVLPLGRALAMPEPARDSKPLVAVTFDDGYLDNFEVAAPILKECGMSATFFVCTGPVRSASHFWYDSIAEGALRWGSDDLKRHLALNDGSLEGASGAHGIVAALKVMQDAVRRAAVENVERRFGNDDWIYRSDVMTPDHVRELASAGHEIGSHTETHPILPQLGATEAARELRGSKAWLEETLGGPVTGFCYPNGDHTPETREWVAQAGYAYACVTEEGRHAPGLDPYRIRRIDVAPNRVADCFDRGSERSFRATISLMRRRA